MTVWQQLGAFVQTAENLSDEHLRRFGDCGGRWITPVVYGDEHSGPWNLAHIASLKSRAHNLTVGGWFNCWGDDPYQDARHIKNIVRDYSLPIAILDLETAYQYPSGDATLMPILTSQIRNLLPEVNIGVTTNNMDNSMIWNGRTLRTPLSFYDLGIRVIPQWYTWIYQQNGAYRPDNNMAWLRDNGGKDFNFIDLNAIKTSKRGVPLSFVHGAIEVTGLENANLEDEFHWVLEACKYGYTKGVVLYTLENIPENDWDTVKDIYKFLCL